MRFEPSRLSPRYGAATQNAVGARFRPPARPRVRHGGERRGHETRRPRRPTERGHGPTVAARNIDAKIVFYRTGKGFLLLSEFRARPASASCL